MKDESVPLSDKTAEGEAESKVLVTSGKSYQPSLSLALIRAFGVTFLFGALFKLMHDILMFVNPQILR